MDTPPPGGAAQRPSEKRARRRRTVNRLIAFVLVADVLALVIVEINHADRPSVSKGGGNDGTAVVLDQAMARLATQLSSTSTTGTASGYRTTSSLPPQRSRP